MSTMTLDPRAYRGSAALASPAAGEVARRVGKLAASAVDTVRVRAARRSFVFDDLRSLAQESGTDLAQEPEIVLAQRFLLALPLNLPAPELSLDDDGDVCFDWLGVNGEMITAALRKDGRLAYAARFSSFDKDHGVKQFVDEIPQGFIHLLQRLPRV